MSIVVEDWDIAYEITVKGKPVTPGVEVHVPWEGRFRFLRHVTNANGAEWVDLYGGKAGHETIRSFRPERITKVFANRTITTRRDRAA